MIKVQTVLFENEPAALGRFLTALAVTVRAFGQGVYLSVGDCSARPLLTQTGIDAWSQAFGDDLSVAANYTYFGENLGFGAGHNRLWRESPSAARVLIVNADSLPAPHLLSRLAHAADARPDWGAVEARQVPIEHPKWWNPTTGETAWVSGACCLVDGAAFDAVGGFDEHFFLYGEDVDLSWRLRDAGKRLYFCPETFVYHAKRLGAAGKIGGRGVLRPVEPHAAEGKIRSCGPQRDGPEDVEKRQPARVCAYRGRVRARMRTGELAERTDRVIVVVFRG